MSKFWANSPDVEDEWDQHSEQEDQPHPSPKPESPHRFWYNEPYTEEGTSSKSSNHRNTPKPKSAKRQKQEQKAANKEYRREQRQEVRREQERLKHMDRWTYLKLWHAVDREAYGTAYDRFSASAAAFLADHTKEFPHLKSHGCERKNCVKGTLLQVCHHEVEVTLRGSGCLDEKMIKRERLRWHPDRWVGKGEVQVKCNELFQLIQRIVDGDVKA